MSQTWLVFGATSDIAIATCLRQADGNHFILVGRSRDRLSNVSEQLTRAGACSVVLHVIDLGDHNAHMKFLRAMDTCPSPTHVLIAQGQLVETQRASNDFESAIKMVEVNALSVLTCMTWVSTKQDVDWVVVLGSVAGDRGRRSNYLYGATKAAVATFISGALMDSPSPKWLLVKAGPVHSKMTKGLEGNPLWAMPGDIARAIATRLNRGNAGTMYAPAHWAFIMRLIRILPSAILKRLPI